MRYKTLCILRMSDECKMYSLRDPARTKCTTDVSLDSKSREPALKTHDRILKNRTVQAIQDVKS